MENIYEMKLHQTLRLDIYTEVLRVAGGWIYTIYSSNEEAINKPTSVFVGFNNEFQK